MKLTRVLLYIAAVANVLFVIFHTWLGWRIHQLARLDPGIRNLLEMLNGGGTLFILFLAVATWLIARASTRSQLGQLVMITAATLFGLRGAVEFVLPPHATPLIVATCGLTMLLYVAALATDRRPFAMNE